MYRRSTKRCNNGTHRNRTLFGFALENNCTRLSLCSIHSAKLFHHRTPLMISLLLYICAKVRSARSGAPPPNCYLIFHWFCFKFSISRCWLGFLKNTETEITPCADGTFFGVSTRIFVCYVVFFIFSVRGSSAHSRQ